MHRLEKKLSLIIVMCLCLSLFLPCIRSSAKTKYCAIYNLSGNKLTYKNVKPYEDSENVHPVGKKKKISVKNNTKYYWFDFGNSGLIYKKITKKKFKSMLSPGQIARIVIKNGKVTKVYGEYQS